MIADKKKCHKPAKVAEPETTNVIDLMAALRASLGGKDKGISKAASQPKAAAKPKAAVKPKSSPKAAVKTNKPAAAKPKTRKAS